MPGVIYNKTTWHVPSTRSNAAPTPAPAKFQDRSFAYIITLWRYHGHRGRGTTTIGPECGLTTPGALKCVIPFFLFLSFSYFHPQDSVHQRPCPAVDLPNSRCNSQGRRKATTNIQVVSITSIKSVLYTIPQPTPWRGTCLIVPSLAYRTICIILHSWQYFLNKQCSTFLLIIAFLSYTYVHL